MLIHFQPLKNQKGMSSIEIIPVLAIFILLVNFSIGFFGVIHSGILNSIAARNYAFETFRNRANLNYLRDCLEDPLAGQCDPPSNPTEYSSVGFRFHSIVDEKTTTRTFIPTVRAIKFTDRGLAMDPKGVAEHNQKVKLITEGKRASEVGIEEGTDPVWIKITYGICLNSNCGDVL